MNKNISTLIFALILIIPIGALAHQPRIPEQFPVAVTDPEISKAYYAELQGEPQIYQISADKKFNLYLSIVVPDIDGQKKDLSALILKNGNSENPLAVLDGTNFSWTRFWEKYGQDWYWQGPIYKSEAGPGQYEIRVWSTNNDSRYSLAIGEVENFTPQEIVNALNLVPRLKRNFFLESPAGFIFSPFGWSYILIMFVLSFIFGFIYRWIIRKLAKNAQRQAHKNIGKADRWLRAIIGTSLFILAITTTWNPIIFFLSGFAFFETIFSWCGFYAAIGKNSCPLN